MDRPTEIVQQSGQNILIFTTLESPRILLVQLQNA